MKNLQGLLEHQLRDLYSAEGQYAEILPKMVAAASDSKLKAMFTDHLKQTKSQQDRVRQLLEDIDVKPGGVKCEAMAGLIKECQGMIDEDTTAAVKDAGLIAEAQRCEHYEISGYGTATKYAMTLGHDDMVEVLDAILDEESRFDEELNDLAIQEINQKAV
ncbi:ferritin-like metal-binding protein YciE [Neolewinella xylanilytica]|uniref:Ferritin-like metal-binding protein YciE n=1 Tax=Neolewinella xylanilytica TaxID=1514080 RepID=A0A2S6I4D6_9BACT|nr:ferritin-like domain-containing protein [Neolewinella xylanilytica]PPK86056.1 ferritin-like metal-binding protein YciE [Neolewinella xylanilytica]